MAVAVGLVVLFLPGMGRLLLALMFTFQLLMGGALVLIALRRAPWRRGWRPDPIRAEAMFCVVLGVLLADLSFQIKAVLAPLVAFCTVFGGALALAGAGWLDARHGRAWLALGGMVSVVAGSVLGAASAALVLHPDAEARLLGADATAFGPTAAAMTAWFPFYAIPWGVSQLALARRLALGAPPWSAGPRREALALVAAALATVLGCLHFGCGALAGAALLALGFAPRLRAACRRRDVREGDDQAAPTRLPAH